MTVIHSGSFPLSMEAARLSRPQELEVGSATRIDLTGEDGEGGASVTAPVAGPYDVVASLVVGGVPTGTEFAAVLKRNGGVLARAGTTVEGRGGWVRIEETLDLLAGDSLTLWGWADDRTIAVPARRTDEDVVVHTGLELEFSG